MKIDFLESGSADCPLIRIYAGQPEACRQLKQAFEHLADGAVKEVALSDLPGMLPVGGCCLIAQAGRRDQGIVRSAGNQFRWVLTPATWDNVAGLVEPFCSVPVPGYQWLDQVGASEARVLISTDGCW
jgi:hypothetical protein